MKESSMADKFFVVLRERDRILDIVQTLERLVAPGAKVTFVVSYPVDTWAWLRDHWITTESVQKAVSSGKRILSQYSWEEQKRLAEIRVAFAREALGRIGVEVTVVLKNAFHRAVRDYMFDSDFRLLLISTANGSATIELLRLMFVFLRRIKASGFISFMPRRSAT
jgi:hypothetical protein